MARRLLKLLNRWREEAEKAGRKIERIAVAFEAGRDGFWLARWLRARGIEAHIIHASSVAVSREHRVAHVGCPDRRIDRLCITCCSPFPTVTSRRMPDAISVTPPVRRVPYTAEALFANQAQVQ